jgi:hypothetical protein
MAKDFYGPASAVCFTLLGLWWVAVQIRGTELFSDPRWRRTVAGVSLCFLLPGLMSLLALVSPETSGLWRASFVLASAAGVAESIAGLRAAASVQILRVGAIVLYVLIAVVGAAPDYASDVTTLSPLLVEGILISLLIALGTGLAWSTFVDSAERPSGGG